MSETLTKEKILQIARTVSRFYDDMAKVDEMVQICGYGEGYQKQLHIYDEADLIKIADIMGLPPEKDFERERISVLIEDVIFFSVLEINEISEETYE